MQITRRAALVLGVIVLALGSGAAFTVRSAWAQSVSVTVYSDPYYNQYGYYGGGGSYSVVKEVRRIELEAGTNEIRFVDVAQLIDGTSVHFKSLLDPEGTYVLEQSFEYDLVSADKVMARYVDLPVTLYDDKGTVTVGRLLSYDYSQVVLETDDPDDPIQIISRGDFIEKIAFPELPGGLLTKPTLVWLVNARTAGVHEVEVAYQTAGMGWGADYTLVLNEADTAMDLSSWVTITNGSGATYEDANLKLVAGDVQRVEAPMLSDSESYMVSLNGGGGGDMGFQEKTFFEYHLYTLGRSTTIGNNSTKQIELFTPAAGVPIEKVYVYDGSKAAYYGYYGTPYTDSYYGTPNEKVDVHVEFENADKYGLGIPLPAGRVRVYKQDPDDGSLEFVGEDRIDHTPKDEDVRLKLGSAFDVVGEWKQSDFKVDWDAQWMEESFEIKLRNHKQEPITVVVLEHLYRWSNWTVIEKSHAFEKFDAQTVTFAVDVEKDAEKVLTYKVRYEW